MKNPLVSIVMITYRHEEFIEESIKGVLMQVCDFDVELIIANDMSPDDTHPIIQNVLLNHPKSFQINYIQRESNFGMMPNFIDALKKAKGKYIALCEGDDYWTDAFKLQKQVDFLENNLDFSICFHRVNIIYENNIIPFIKDINKHTPEVTTIYDLFKGNYIHTPSVMFRRHDDFPEWMKTAYPGDWPLHIINAIYGKIKFLNETMASYRVHYGGIHSTTGGLDFIEKIVQTFKNICDELEERKLYSEVKQARKNYDFAYASFYGLNVSKNLKLNRFKKSMLLLKKGNIKFKLFFWLPIFFGDSSHKVVKFLSSNVLKYFRF